MHNIPLIILAHVLAATVIWSSGAGATMLEFLQTPPVQAVIWFAVLVVLCVIGAYVVLWFRNRRVKSGSSASDMLTHFRELRDEGELSQTEFRGVKSILGARLQDELDSNRAERED